VEHIAFAPTLEHGLFELGEALCGVDGGIARHGCVDSRRDLITLQVNRRIASGTRSEASGGPK
jgi:hypothetical protein